jgi:ABC-type nitrate/sulfonate/bicarbonate transport system substrate-binding protein
MIQKKISVITLLILTAVLSVLIIGGCSNDKEKTESIKDKDSIKLQLPWTIQAQFAGPILATRPGGFYEQEGLEVDIVEGGFNINTPAEVAKGNAQFAIMQPDQLIYFNAQESESEKDLIAIAVIFQESMTCFMTRKDSGIKTIKDFRGKRIGVKEGTNVDNEFNALIAKAGLDREKDFQTVPVQWDIGIFIKGDIDVFPGFSINEPFQARKAGVETELLSPAQFGLELYGDVIVTTKHLTKENPRLVKAFVKATLNGWKEAFATPKEAVALILKQNPLLETEHQEFMLDASKNLAMSNGKMTGKSDENVWKNMVTILEKYGTLEAGSVDYLKLFTNDFLPNINTDAKDKN